MPANSVWVETGGNDLHILRHSIPKGPPDNPAAPILRGMYAGATVQTQLDRKRAVYDSIINEYA